MFLKNKNIIFKIRRSKVTDYAALSQALYSKICLNWPLAKRQKIGFKDQLSLNAGQRYCRMLQWEHSAILSTSIKLPFDIKIFVLFEWQLKTGFTVSSKGLLVLVQPRKTHPDMTENC